MVAFAACISIITLGRWGLSLYSFISWIIKKRCKVHYKQNRKCLKFPRKSSRCWGALNYWLSYLFNVFNGFFIYQYTL